MFLQSDLNRTKWFRYVLLAISAGMVLPAQGRINAEVAEVLQDPVFAGLLSFATGLALMAVLTFGTAPGLKSFRRVGPALRAGKVHWWFLAAGGVGAYLVLTQTWTLGALGVAVFTIALVTGQLLGGLLCDALGITSVQRVRIGVRSLVGTALAVGAVLLSVGPTLKVQGAEPLMLLLVALPFLAGLAGSFQQVLNGRQTQAYGGAIPVAFFNYAAGAIVLCLVMLAWSGFPGMGALLPLSWWHLLAGPLGCIFIGFSAILVPRVGALLTTMGVVAGQLIGSLILDVWVPVPGSNPSLLTFIGTACVLGGVGLVVADRASRRD